MGGGSASASYRSQCNNWQLVQEFVFLHIKTVSTCFTTTQKHELCIFQKAVAWIKIEIVVGAMRRLMCEIIK